MVIFGGVGCVIEVDLKRVGGGDQGSCVVLLSVWCFGVVLSVSDGLMSGRRSV